LIAALEPDVVAVGSDYREEQVKGLDIIKGYGGRVLFVQREPIASSAILAKQK
jgi:bifunctional ADP-heptose synthase (sugar kinase/adenylyltransferase)